MSLNSKTHQTIRMGTAARLAFANICRQLLEQHMACIAGAVVTNVFGVLQNVYQHVQKICSINLLSAIKLFILFY